MWNSHDPMLKMSHDVTRCNSHCQETVQLRSGNNPLETTASNREILWRAINSWHIYSS